MEYEKLVEDQQSEDASRPRLRVAEDREIQAARFKECSFFCNPEMSPAEVWKYCQLDDSAKGLLQTATQRLNLSAWAFHRILNVSRTIADLEGAGGINIAAGDVPAADDSGTCWREHAERASREAAQKSRIRECLGKEIG